MHGVISTTHFLDRHGCALAGLMRVTAPSGVLQAELRLSAEGATREAALRYIIRQCGLSCLRSFAFRSIFICMTLARFLHRLQGILCRESLVNARRCGNQKPLIVSRNKVLGLSQFKRCVHVFASAMERADARAIRSHVDHLTTMDTLQDYTKRCDELLEATLTAQRRAETMEDALSTAQRGYDEQIAIMTEHMVGMNDRAKEQEEQFR